MGAPWILTLRRIFILPTGWGVVFALTLLVMLLGAVNYDKSLGYMLTFMLGSLALVSMLHTYRNMAGLGVTSGRCESVFAGEDARFSVWLDNRHHPNARYALTLYPGRRERHAKPVVVSLGADERRAVILRVPTQGRGQLKLERTTLASRYPLGLFRAWSPLASEAQCLVYPRPEGRPELPHASASSTGNLDRGGGEEDFCGLRAYRTGDPMRRVHWKAAARQNDLPVKEFTGSDAGELALRWDALRETDVEARLSQLCLWCLKAEHAGHRYSLELPERSIAPDRGKEHLERCLSALALHGLGDG